MILHGDCRAVMATMEPNSVDAIVCDPPYGLNFMGKEWDNPGAMVGASNAGTRNWALKKGDPGYVAGNAAWYGHNDPRKFQAWNESWLIEAFRVLKPGGHLVAFGGTRTVHRLTVAIEDAGFEIRDTLVWMYGSGFPKSANVSKMIDKMAGAERDVIGTKLGRPGMAKDGRNQSFDSSINTYGNGGVLSTDITAPATDAAKQWDGWGSALKPAHEPIVLARKPLGESTIAGNVLAWGTGALNIDATRISHQSAADRAESEAKNQHTRYKNPNSNRDSYSGDYPPRTDYNGAAGRWPPFHP